MSEIVYIILKKNVSYTNLITTIKSNQKCVNTISPFTC
jgi:hypothetical protein